MYSTPDYSDLVRRSRLFWIGYAVVFLGGILLQTIFSPREIFFAINGFHHYWGDYFFQYYTDIGAGYMVAVVSLLFFFRRIRWALAGIISFLLSGGAVQVLKRFVFEERHRPWKIWADDPTGIYLIEGLTPHTNNSFPSGHTTTAFAMFSLLAMVLRFRGCDTVYLILACAVGYSRIYLAQHQFLDVHVGSLLGVFGTLLVMRAFTPGGWLYKPSPLLDRRLLGK